MKTLSLIAPFVLFTPWSGAGPAPPREGSPKEPPQRVRVTVGGEVLELALGGPGGALADGREVAVELLPTRVFAVDGAFLLEYPGGWRFSGTGVTEGCVDAWWTLGGERVHLYLRRHGSAAEAILLEYVGNCEATGASGRRPASLELDGRCLDGFAVEKEIGGMHGGAAVRATFEIFAWQEREGVAWLLQIQRDTPLPAAVDFPTFDLELVDSGQQGPVTGPATPTADGLSVVLDSFRWNEGD